MVTSAAIYCRISQDRDGEQLGVQRQQDLCQELADRKGWGVAHVFVDNDMSAYATKLRPGYEAMIEGITNGTFDAVICVDLDRLTRRTVELERFIELVEKHKISIANTSGDIDLGTSDGLFKAKLMANIAQHESQKKSERLKRQRAQAAKRGVWSGAAPFGYTKDDGKLVAVEDEAAMIQQAAADVIDGAITWRGVAQRWNALGVTSRRGNEWTTNSARVTLTSPSIAGLSVHAGEVVGDGEWEPILDRATYEALRSIRDRRKGHAGRPPSLLTQLVSCGLCEAKLYAGNRGGGKQVYVCRKSPGEHHGCGRLSIGRTELEDHVIAIALPLLAEMPEPKAQVNTEEVTKLEQKLKALEVRRSEFASLFGEGLMTRAEFEAARIANSEAIDALTGELAAKGGGNDFDNTGTSPSWYRKMNERRQRILDGDELPEEIKNHLDRDTIRHQIATGGWDDVWPEDQLLLATLAEWLGATTEERRRLLSTVIESITILPYPKDGKRAFDPTRVAIQKRR